MAEGIVPALEGLGFEASLGDVLPDVPDSLHPVSPIYDVKSPGSIPGPYVLTLRLNSVTQDQRALGAYEFRDGVWEQLDRAILTEDGAGARVELDKIPENIAILSRLQFRDMVTGRLPVEIGGPAHDSRFWRTRSLCDVRYRD